MEKSLIRAFLEAYAVGDAYGKATEYCNRIFIEKHFNHIDKILTPEESLSHKDLPYGRITDDTEQNIYLIREYSRRHRVNAKDTADCLLRWIRESDALKYIGPSSYKALTAIENGQDAETSGKSGITCGGIMRTPAAFFFSNSETLESNVIECLKPTHFTSVAIEAAMAYAFALQSASGNSSLEEILDSACLGAKKGRMHGNSERACSVGPSIEARIRFLYGNINESMSESNLKYLLYDVLGSTMASYDVASSVFGLFMYCKTDVKRLIRLAAEMGGDSDSIASLGAGLAAIYSKGHNIDRNEVNLVEKSNNIDFNELANLIDKEMNK